ncbi:MAG: hypothetical protein N2C14_26125, partial [Planctomycetales bacterium]
PDAVATEEALRKWLASQSSAPEPEVARETLSMEDTAITTMDLSSLHIDSITRSSSSTVQYQGGKFAFEPNWEGPFAELRVQEPSSLPP